MSSPLVSPGPAAAEAFNLGLWSTATVVTVAVTILYANGHLSAAGALLVVVLGLPVCLIVVSCALGVWLGYDNQALTRVSSDANRAE